MTGSDLSENSTAGPGGAFKKFVKQPNWLHMQNPSYKTEHSTILAKKKEFSLSTYKSMFKTLKLV